VEVTGWRKLHNGKIHNIVLFKPRMKWAVLAVCMGIVTAYKELKRPCSY
jgi:hypothetical protein